MTGLNGSERSKKEKTNVDTEYEALNNHTLKLGGVEKGWKDEHLLKDFRLYFMKQQGK